MSGGTRVPLEDAADRAAAQLDLERSFAVEAGAGTGKTTILVERILNLVGEKHCPIDRIAAITFTKLSAGELSDRVRMGLEKRIAEAEKSGVPGRAAVYRRALGDFDAAQISTIHSFCGAILRKWPGEAEVDPGFRPQEEGDDKDLPFGRAWDRWIAEVSEDSSRPEARGLLAGLRAGVDISRFRDVLLVLAGRRELLSDFLSAPPVNPPFHFAEEFRNLHDELGNLLMTDCKEADDLLASALLSGLEASAPLLALPNERLLFTLFRTASPVPVKLSGGKKDNWRGGKAQVDDLKIRVKAFRRTAKKEDFVAGGWRDRFDRAMGDWVISGLRPSIARFFEAFDEEKDREGILDFGDLLRKTRDLLASSKDIRREIRETFDAILVDEFQDTDPLQVEIVSLLAGLGSELRHGGLLLVGDPKQSIYRFRRADIESYSSTCQALSDEPDGAVARLTTNFRSDPRILGFVNALFRPLFEKGKNGEGAARQAGWVDLAADPARPDSSPSIEPAVAVLVAEITEPAAPAGDEDPKKPNAADSRRVEAAVVAERIASLLLGGRLIHPKGSAPRAVCAGDVSILFRALSDVGLLEDELRSRGIGYVIEGGKSFYFRQEVAAAIHALRVLEAPHERFSVFAALRSPLFSIPEEEIWRARLQGSELDPTEPLHRTFTPGDAVGDALRILRDLRERRNDRSLAVTIESLLDAVRARETLLARRGGERALANLEALVAIARRLDSERSATYGEMVDLLSDRLDQEREEAESPAGEEGTSAVRILSIHKSKGLEFPVVFLVDLGRQQSRDAPAVIAAGRSDGSRGLELSLGPCRTGGYAEALESERAAANAEAVRMFYVAATRARDLLVISLIGEMGAGSFLAHLDEADSLSKLRTGDSAGLGATFDLWSCEIPPPREMDLEEGDGDPRDVDSRVVRFEAALAGRRALSPVASHLAPPPSAVEIGGGEDLPAADRGESGNEAGKRFGIALHSILERAPISPSIESGVLKRLARDVANESAIAEEEPRLIEHVDRLAVSPLWRRLCVSSRVLRELDFVRKKMDGTIQEGKIDLLFEEADGLVLVDWKTDAGGWDRIPGERRSHYAAQLADYRGAIEQLVPEMKVKESILFFTATGEERKV